MRAREDLSRGECGQAAALAYDRTRRGGRIWTEVKLKVKVKALGQQNWHVIGPGKQHCPIKTKLHFRFTYRLQALITQSTAIRTATLDIAIVSRIVNALKPLWTTESSEASAQLVLDTNTVPITRWTACSRRRNTDLVVGAGEMLLSAAATTDAVGGLGSGSWLHCQGGTFAVLESEVNKSSIVGRQSGTHIVFWLRATAFVEALLFTGVFAETGLGPGHWAVDGIAGAFSGWGWSWLYGLG